MPKTRRLQVLVDQDQWDRLEATASARGTSVAAIVRSAIDAMLPGGKDARRRAAEAILASDPMPVPDPEGLRAELDTARGRVG